MKRACDIVISLVLLVLLSPVLAAISLVILLDDGAPVIFRQERVGRDNKIFSVLKFRTMRKDTPNVATADLTDSDKYITKSGDFLRKTSLDELPQLINVLNGSMSFIGPRPLIPDETEIRELRKEHGVYAVRPGVTGWAQVNGRDILSPKEKVLYDREYVNNLSLSFDFLILLRTVKVVLKREDIAEGSEKKQRR